MKHIIILEYSSRATQIHTPRGYNESVYNPGDFRAYYRHLENIQQLATVFASSACKHTLD